MRRPLSLAAPAAVAALALLAPLVAGPSPAVAGTRSIVDNGDYDVIHRDIDMTRLKVTYRRKAVRAELRFADLRQARRLRILVSFTTRPDESLEAPTYGNFVELRLNPSRKRSVVNWVINPAYDDYRRTACLGVKAKPDYQRDVITYVVPRRCMRFDKGRGYVASYASARKYTPQDWTTGSPGASTGRWFDTTYGFRTPG
ncbi:hypothetical protein [Nocardioides sp.]|uniref:hypothetical protein n=1 Tax=Nocardioides sp. TaxID=35761 RepID=UPI002724EE55|nr:hypothetical protein [Nocardioides sp.]MDO9456903.1 hypothetical protein [Nocardioides sp.]